MRILLAVNARSGDRTDGRGLAATLRDLGAEVEVVDIREVGRAPEAQPERIVVAGGDGSIGPAAEAAARAAAPLAVIPTGTANDFARALGLPLDVDAAARLAVTGTRTVAVELARADERPFVNAASTGLSVVAAHRARPLKPRLGPLAYAVGALRAAITGHPVAARVDADGETVFDGEAWQVVVGATGAFGGGSGLDQADPHDGLLDVVVLEARSRVALVRRAWGLRFGRITRQPGVRHARAERIDVRVPPGTQWNVDGEVCTLEPATFTAERGAVEVVVP